MSLRGHSSERLLSTSPTADALFPWGQRTYVMGIVNVTPDSFSGDGIQDPDAAIARGVFLAENGADILDVGGESTRPGSTPVDPDEELRRVVPVIWGLHQRVSVPISVDTYRAKTAEAALQAGATVVNDIWGFQRDPELAPLVARHGAHAIAMHNRRGAAASAAGVGGFFPRIEYGDLMADIVGALKNSVRTLEATGVPRERIIVDPGIGFGKTPEQNFELLRRLEELGSLGLPLLVGPSRKSFIGLALGGLAPDDRVEGTAAVVALAIAKGAEVVRVHDLPAMARVARMADAIVRTAGS
jgi:dihydropteroate synthase